MPCHGHVYYVPVAQVEFGDASRTFHDDGGEARSQSVESLACLSPEPVLTLSAKVAVGVAVAYRHSIEHHLRRVVRLRLEKYGVHVNVTRNHGGFGLCGLCPSYLQSFWRGIGVESHVLRLERGRMKAVLSEYAAERGSDDAFSRIAAGSCKHNVSESHFCFHRLWVNGFRPALQGTLCAWQFVVVYVPPYCHFYASGQGLEYTLNLVVLVLSLSLYVEVHESRVAEAFKEM